MDRLKIKKLHEGGWKTGSAADFLKLTEEEAEYVELKVSLAQYLQKKRKTKHLTQDQMARMVQSSQSRVAKMERSDPSVSLDLMVRTLLALGTSKTELARALVA
jgi:predicted XRE-type DNA-binding protein